MTDEIIFPTKPIAGERPRTAERIPPEAFFICSAIFHYLGPIVLAAFGVRTMRNLAALLLACGGVFLLTSVRISGEPIGYIFAFANCALFVLYILLGHRIAATGGRGGVERLALAMVIAS